MAVNQADVDARFDEVGTALKGLAADIEFLKNNTTPGEPMTQANYDRLASAAAAAKALDEAFTPPEPPAAG